MCNFSSIHLIDIFIEDLKYAWTFLLVYNQNYSWEFWLTEVLKKNLVEKGSKDSRFPF